MYCHRHGYIWLTVFLLWNILPAQGQEPDREQRPKWEIELAGALDNYGLWEVEPSVTYRLSRHTGLTLGLWMAGSPEGISFGGTTADRHWRWQTYSMDDYTRFFALRPSFRWRSPTWWLGRDKDFGLGLVLSPGATLPLPANHTLQIDYFPNQEGVWTAIRSERVKNRGALAVRPRPYRSYRTNKRKPAAVGRLYLLQFRPIRKHTVHHSGRQATRRETPQTDA